MMGPQLVPHVPSYGVHRSVTIVTTVWMSAVLSPDMSISEAALSPSIATSTQLRSCPIVDSLTMKVGWPAVRAETGPVSSPFCKFSGPLHSLLLPGRP